jgi:type I restriction enzyme, S subunit
MKLKPYPEYKASGVEWLGMVPSNWDIGGVTKFIGPIVDYRGRTPNKVDEGIFLVTARNIKNGKIDYAASEEYVDADSVESLLERGRPEIGDVLFTMEAPLGQVALIDRVDIALAQRIVKFRGKENVLLNTFLLRWLMGSYCQAKLETLATGSTALGIKSSKLGEIECLIPPLEEQSSIVTFLDKETAKLDTLIAKQEKLLELIKERIIATVMRAISSSETTHIRLIHVCEVISRPINLDTVSSFTRLGALNHGRGLFKREDTDSEDMGDSDFFWVKSGDLVLSGQFAWEGSIALANDEHDNCVVSHRFPIIRGKSGIVLTEYLLALLMSSYGDFLLNESSRGSAGRNRPLNMSLLLKEKIPIASKEVQNEIAKLLRIQKKLKDKSEIQINLLKEHRTALISAAVTGKIDVREAA